MYKERHIRQLIDDMKSMYGGVLLIGARQVGKTTFLEHYTELDKVSLDDNLACNLAKEEPATFLKANPFPLFLDEVQRAPELFQQIKFELDDRKGQKGILYMTGSEQPKLMKGASESLSGRIGIARLYGLSMRELYSFDYKKPFLPAPDYIEERKAFNRIYSDDELWAVIHRGCMPELALNQGYRWDIFYSSYVSTYIDRDVKGDIDRGNELKFTKFLVSCAAACGELLNLSSIARDVGISQPTAERWLSKLVETNVVYLLRPYYKNIQKRVIKAPKLYFSDTGLAAYLTRWNTPEALRNGACAGHLFENFVIMEIVKSYYNYSPSEPPLYFYRDTNQKEIDLLIEDGDTLYPVEIKMTADPSPKDISAFGEIDKISGIKRGSGALICRRDEASPISENDYLIPVGCL